MFVTLAIINTAANVFYTVVFLIYLFGLRYSEKELLEDLTVLFSRKQWDNVETLLNRNPKYFFLRESIINMVQARNAPWRILLEYEEAMAKRRKFVTYSRVGLFFKRLLDIVGVFVIAWTYTTIVPDAYFWAVTSVISYLIASFVHIQVTYSFDNLGITITKVRNLLYFHLDYIPPEYLGHKVRNDAEREAWKKEILRIEGDILAGQNPDEASAAALARMRKYYENTVLNSKAEPPPTSKMDLLLNY